MKSAPRRIVTRLMAWGSAAALLALVLWALPPGELRQRFQREDGDFAEAVEQARIRGDFFPRFSFARDRSLDEDIATYLASRLASFGETSMLADSPERDAFRLFVTDHLGTYGIVARLEPVGDGASATVIAACSGEAARSFRTALSRSQWLTFLRDIDASRFWTAGNPHARLRSGGDRLTLTPWVAEGRARGNYQLVDGSNAFGVNLSKVEEAFMKAAGFDRESVVCDLAR